MAIPSRNARTRAATARPGIGGDAGGVLGIDLSALNKEYEVMWATEQVLGADFRENVRMQMQQRGFQPVLVSDMPGEAPPLLPGETRGEHDVIRRGGMVLMKRPRRIGQDERADLSAQNADALRSVNREFEESIRSREGLERLPDSGVSDRIERGTARRPSPEFPE